MNNVQKHKSITENRCFWAWEEDSLKISLYNFWRNYLSFSELLDGDFVTANKNQKIPFHYTVWQNWGQVKNPREHWQKVHLWNPPLLSRNVLLCFQYVLKKLFPCKIRDFLLFTISGMVNSSSLHLSLPAEDLALIIPHSFLLKILIKLCASLLYFQQQHNVA